MKEFFETKKGLIFLNFIKYLFFFVCMYLFCVGGIRGEITPFAFGFFVALCWCEQNVFFVSAIFVGANLLASFSVPTIFSSVFCAGVIIVFYFFHKKIHARIPAFLIAVYAIISQSVFLYFKLTNFAQVVPALLHVVLGILFMFASICIFKTLFVKGLKFKRTIDEYICICAFLVALGSGLSAVGFFDFSLLNVFATFLILICTYCFASSSVPLIAASSLGIGSALQTGNFMFVATFVFLSIGAVVFKSSSKYFSVLAIIICDVVLGLYFNVYDVYNYKILISTVVGELLFLCISDDSILILKSIFAESNSNIALRGMVNKSRDILCKKMNYLSEIFDEMDRSFKSTIKGVLPASEAKRVIKEEFMNKVCYDCPEKHRCYRVLQRETNETFDAIIAAGLDRGKVTLLDIPPFLSTRCNKTAVILNTLNGLIANYKQWTYCVNSVDMSKALVAEEFKGVSKLMQSLATQTKQLITFDTEMEDKIAEELEYANIRAMEIYVFEKDDKISSCLLTIKSEDVENVNLQNILSKIFGTKMILISAEQAEFSGFVVAEYVEAPKYDCIYGSSGTAKFGNSTSGDSYSFIKLSGGKVLFAICDGMGSGEAAQKISDTTISLIENFYKAGFDDETILSSVNKLLSMQMTDNYSALDICVLDLKTCFANFIKVGAPACFVKHKESTEILVGGSLPVGILKEIKPSVSKKVLDGGDIVVLCSDGVIDAFEETQKLQNYINNIMSTNPQEIADIILNEAISQNQGEPRDDMTVVCARIFVGI